MKHCDCPAAMICAKNNKMKSVSHVDNFIFSFARIVPDCFVLCKRTFINIHHVTLVKTDTGGRKIETNGL